MNITKQIDAALAEVTAAESALELVLRELNAGVRAEKVKVSEVVESAFTRLRNGRIALSKLREDLVAEAKAVVEDAEKEDNTK
jgi:hypothetical protein